MKSKEQATDLTLVRARETDVLISKLNDDLAKNTKIAGLPKVMRLQDLHEQPTISTGVSHLDTILRGGIVQGGITEIFGKKQSGKTALALSIAGQVDGVMYIDGDQAITQERAELYGGHGNYIIYQPYCLEQALEHMILLFKSGMVQLAVIDSLPSVPTRKQREEPNMDKHTGMALTAGLLSRVLGGLNGLLHETGATLVIVNQMRANFNVASAWAEQYHTFGGNMLPSLAHVRLSTIRKRWKKDEKLGIYGAETSLWVDKAKHCLSQRGVDTNLIFPHGFVEKEDLPRVMKEVRQMLADGRYVASQKIEKGEDDYDEEEGKVITVEAVNSVKDRFDQMDLEAPT